MLWNVEDSFWGRSYGSFPNQNSIQSMEKSGVTSTEETKSSAKQHQVNVDLFLCSEGNYSQKNLFLLVKQLMVHSTSKFWNVYGRMCEGSDLISGGTTHGCSTMTMRQPMLPSWLDGFWPITTWLWCHILPNRPTLHPATFSYIQNWKWSLRAEDIRRWRKFKQNRRPSCARYEKMNSRNASKTGSAAGIVVKPQMGTTFKGDAGP